MGKRKRERKIVTIMGLNIEINNDKNPVRDQLKKVIDCIDSILTKR